MIIERFVIPIFAKLASIFFTPLTPPNVLDPRIAPDPNVHSLVFLIGNPLFLTPVDEFARVLATKRMMGVPSKETVGRGRKTSQEYLSMMLPKRSIQKSFFVFSSILQLTTRIA